MAPTIDLYIDIFAQTLLAGPLNAGATNPSAPLIMQSDTPTWRIFLLTPTYNPITPYTQVPTGGLTLEVVVAQKIGGGGTQYASQYAWTPSVDPNNPNYWSGSIAFNTAAINTLLAGLISAPAWLQVAFVAGGFPTTVLQMPVTINATCIPNAGVAVQAGLTPASMEYVNATFLTRTISGVFFWVDPNTNKKFAIYVGDDNSLHADAVN